MVSRVYVEKKPGFDVEAQQLLAELRDTLGIEALTALRVINRYDVEGIDEELFARCVPTVFSEPQVDIASAELPAANGPVFAVEALPGQFDQRADSASECIQLISQGERPTVRAARVYLLDEPISGVDPATRDVILDGILREFDPASLLIMSTHLISDIEHFVDYAIFMKDGQVLLQGDADDLRAAHGDSLDAIFRKEYR